MSSLFISGFLELILYFIRFLYIYQSPQFDIRLIHLIGHTLLFDDDTPHCQVFPCLTTLKSSLKTHVFTTGFDSPWLH